MLLESLCQQFKEDELMGSHGGVFEALISVCCLSAS